MANYQDSILGRTVSKELSFPSAPGPEFIDEKKDARFIAAQETVQYYEWYADCLRDQFDKAVKWWKMYLLISNSSYKPWEYWRNRLLSSMPNTVIEVSTAHIVTQILADGNPVVPEAYVGEGREGLEKRIKDWFTYSFRKNHFARELELFIREMLIQSMSVRKNVLVQKVREIVHFPSPAEAAAFDSELQHAVQQMGIAPPLPEQYATKEEFMDSFKTFRDQVNSSGGRLPEFPMGGPKKIAHYVGPGWKRISMFSFFYDPSLPIHDNDGYILESMVPEKWVESQCGDTDEFPFDKEMVDKAKGGTSKIRDDVRDTQGRNQWESKLAATLASSAVNQDIKASPRMKDPVHLLEHFKPGDKVPYRVVMNGRVCINKKKSNPFSHGDTPYTIATNVNVPFNSSGLSDLMPGENLFKEQTILRSLILDGVKLSVLPMFSRIKDAGLTDLAKFLIPGMILDAPRGSKSIEQISTIDPPLAAYKQVSELKSEIEDATATYPQSRGAIGPQGVTATQSERAFQGLTLRNQIKIHRIESDMNNLPSQWLSIAHQFLEEEHLSTLNKQLVKDITGQYGIEDFFQAIELDWVFKASRMASNKDMLLQQLKDIFTMGANAFAGSPVKPASIERLYMAIVRKIDPDIAQEIQTTPEEQMKQQAEADMMAAMPPQPGAEGAPA